MHQEYNSRQRKIYNDYKEYTSDNLFEMVKNSNKYIPEVIEVINDILIERNLILPRPKETVKVNDDRKEFVGLSTEKDDYLSEEKHKYDEMVKSFVMKLKEKDDAYIFNIITRYINYEEENVEAALTVSVDRGHISYELKVLLLSQITANFIAHKKHLKQYKWEKNNAFIKYVSKYQDEDILNFIEDPSNIVIDVYHAILITGKDRELISQDDFTRLYKEAKLATRSDFEIRRDEIDEFFREDNPESVFENETEIEAEKAKFWKCPSCNQLVDMDLGVCWNCQAAIPDNIEHPDTEEILKEKASVKNFNPIKSGLYVTGGGIVIFLLGFERSYFKYYHYHRFVLGAVFVVIGILIISFGLIGKAKLKKDSN